MPTASARSLTRVSLPLMAAMVLLGVAIIVGAAGWATHAERVATARRADLLARASAVLDEFEHRQRALRAQAVEPVDAYFDLVAIPGVPGFLGEFSGLIDSPVYAWRWTNDRVGVAGRSDRVERAVRAALATHLGFPKRLGESVGVSLERYVAMVGQEDAELRHRVYELLSGRGVEVDRGVLSRGFERALARALDSAGGEGGVLARDTRAHASISAGKEVGVLALQGAVVGKAVSAVASRMGVVTIGGAAAAGTAGAGAATGVGAVPGVVLAGVEIAVVVVVDLAVSSWLDARAQAHVTDDLNALRLRVGEELGVAMNRCERELRAARMALIEEVLR